MDRADACSKCGGNDFIAWYTARVECRLVNGELRPYEGPSKWEFDATNAVCAICGTGREA